MAISYASSIITVEYGTTYGTATSGTTTTCTDSGKSWTTSAYIGRFIVFTSGSNAGQYPRYITANTGTQITFTPALPNAVANTDAYYVNYDLADIYAADVAGGWGKVTTQGNQYRLTAQVKVGTTNVGFLGDINKEVTFSDFTLPTGSSAYIRGTGTGYMNFGRCTDYTEKRTSDGCAFFIENTSGGNRQMLSGSASTPEYPKVYVYGCNFLGNTTAYPGHYGCAVLGTLVAYNCNYSKCGINTVTTVNDLYNVYISRSGFGLLFLTASTNTINKVTVDDTSPYDAIYHEASSGSMTVRDCLLHDNTYDFYLQNNGSPAPGFTNHLYVIDTVVDRAWHFRWGSTPTATGPRCYRQYSVNINVKNAGASNVQYVQIAVYNSGGTEQFNVATNSSGNTAEQIISYGYYAKPDGDTMTALGPYTFKYRRYGYIAKQITKDWTQKTLESIVLETNPYVVANESTASAYTGISISGSGKTITLSSEHSIQEIYDYSQTWADDSGNIQYDEPITTIDGTTFTLTSGWVIVGAENLTSNGDIINGGSLKYNANSFPEDISVNTTTFIFNYAGTYDFSGFNILNSITLTNTSGGSVAVRLQSTVDYTNSGPNITVLLPLVYQKVIISGATAGSRIQIYDLTSDTELYKGTPTFPYTWTDSSAYVDDRQIRLRIAYVSGTTAKEFIDTVIGTCTELSPTVSYLVNQYDDEVYNTNAINGSLVTGVSIDDANILVSVDTGSITWQQLYAYEAYWLSTNAGIVDEGKYTVAVDIVNYKWYDFKLKNITSPSVPLVVSGGYGVDGDTGQSIDMIDDTGGTIILAPDHVVPTPAVGTEVWADSKALTVGKFIALK